MRKTEERFLCHVAADMAARLHEAVVRLHIIANSSQTTFTNILGKVSFYKLYICRERRCANANFRIARQHYCWLVLELDQKWLDQRKKLMKRLWPSLRSLEYADS